MKVLLLLIFLTSPLHAFALQNECPQAIRKILKQNNYDVRINLTVGYQDFQIIHKDKVIADMRLSKSFKFIAGRRMFYVCSLSVLENYRKQGLSKALFQMALHNLGENIVFGSHMDLHNKDIMNQHLNKLSQTGADKHLTPKERLLEAFYQTPAYKARKALGIHKILRINGEIKEDLDIGKFQFYTTLDDPSLADLEIEFVNIK